MPATESTWREMSRMHRIFAVSGVVLTISTLWMFWKDHYRSWKVYQASGVNVDLRLTRLRKLQFETGEAAATHELKAAELAAAQAQAFDADILDQFKAEAGRATATLNRWRDNFGYSSVTLDTTGLDRRAKELQGLA